MPRRSDIGSVLIIGAGLDAIRRAEDRDAFKELARGLGLDVPRSGTPHSVAEADALCALIGFPVSLRASRTLGRTGGGVPHASRRDRAPSAMRHHHRGGSGRAGCNRAALRAAPDASVLAGALSGRARRGPRW